MRVTAGLYQALFAVCTLLAVLAALALPKPPTGGPVVIGANFGLTGSVARYGTWAQRGVELAAAEVNAKGGVSGRPLQVIFEDNGGDPSHAVAAFRRLRAASHGRYIITFLSPVALAISPLANRDRVVQMDVSAASPRYSTPDDYTFRTSVSAVQLAAQAAETLYGRLAIKRLGILFLEDDFGQGMADVLVRSYKGEIAAQDTLGKEGADYLPQILKMQKARLDAIWFVGHLYESGRLLHQARSIGFKGQFFSDMYSVEGPEFLETAGAAAEGLLYFSVAFRPEHPAAAGFSGRYEAEFHEPPNYYAAQAYDGLLALAAGIRACPDERPGCVREALSSVKFDGASGRIEFDRYGDVKKALTIKKISGGKFVSAQEDAGTR